MEQKLLSSIRLNNCQKYAISSLFLLEVVGSGVVGPSGPLVE